MIRLHLATAALAAFSLGVNPAASQTGPASAEQVQGAASLSAEDMRVLAQQLLNAGRAADSTQVLNALLDRDPNDAAALILGAQAALDQGLPAQATGLAGRGYRAAGDDTSRYVAARLAARAHAEQKQDTRAQFWLRRARQVAPSAQGAESVAQDYAFLRNRNPLSFNLSFGASPSNNINNGSRSDTATIGPFVTVLSESAKPLSGIQFDAAVSARYRAHETNRSQLSFGVDLRTTTYALNQSAKDALQRDIDASLTDTSDLPRNGSDFSYSEASFSLIQKQIFKAGARPTTMSVQIGKSWYGGDPYQRFVAPSVSHTFALGRTDQLRLDGFARLNQSDREERTDVFGAPINDPDILNYGLGVTYSTLQAFGDVVNLGLAHRISRSDRADNNFSAWRISAGLDLAEPIMNVKFGFGFQMEERDYGDSIYVDGTRRDRIVNAQIAAQFDNVEYYGFIPVMTLGVGRTFSAAERFDTEYATIGMDLRSAF
ncbi:tetratricopeptide repeat protein [Loktanella salsilacus]|uniref:tetratricopeptide repeat protein n=1 Tax=Loktanella salsilacus TaxID=195913 RepID=UPI0037350644